MKSFIFGADDLPKTPAELARLRAMADALTPSRSPQNVGEGIASIGNAIVYRALLNKADKGEAAGRANADSMFSKLFGTDAAAFPPAPGAETSAAPVSVAAPEGLKDGIVQTASALGIDPVDLGTAISYETAGTFDPTKAGPTTQWGQHKGLIQFGEPQAKKYGVDWSDPVGSQLGPNGAVANYLRDAGVKPGMGMMDVYSAINAGRVGRYGASDANNGGAPGTVADKVNNQMAGHRAKALALLGPSAAAASPFEAQPGAAATASPALGYAGGARRDDPSLVYDTEGMRMERPSYKTSAGNQPYNGPGARMDMIRPLGTETVPATQGEINQAAQRGDGVTQSPDWLPAEFQNSPQLRGADPDIGILRALTGRGPGTGMPQQTAQALDLNQAIQAMSDPFMDPGKRAVLEALVQRRMAAEQAQQEQLLKQQSPDYQLDLKLKQAQIDKLENPPKARLLTAEEKKQLGLPDKGAYQLTPDNKIDQVEGTGAPPTPTDIQEYEYAKSQGFAGSFIDFQLAQKKAAASTTTINTGETDKFYQKMDEKNAETFSNLSDGGIQARSRMGQIDRLEQLMANAPQGAVGALKQAAGEWGLPTEGVSDIQAASSLLERMVPEQRAPGSGPMSDADIKMYRASLPRLLNQPGGNQLIFQTMRGIAQYEMQMGDIADKVANREITPAEGRRMIKELKNPLADFKPPAAGPTPNEGWKELPGVPGGVKIRLKGTQ